MWKFAAGIKCLTVAGKTALRVIGVDALDPSVAQLLLHRPARKAQPGLVEKGAELVRAGDPHHHRRRVRQIAEERFAFAQRGFGLLALGDIQNHSHQASRLAGVVKLYVALRKHPAKSPIRR